MKDENNQAPVEQTDQTSGENSQQDQVKYETFQKLLNEKKNVQGKLSEYEAELQSLREEKLQREGNHEKLIEDLRKKNTELSTNLSKKDQSYAWNTLTSEIKREAMRAGCENPDKLIRLLDDEDLRSIEVGENFSIDKQSLSAVLEKAKRENSFLFKSSNKITANGNPSTKIEENNKLNDLSKLSMEELKELHLKHYK